MSREGLSSRRHRFPVTGKFDMSRYQEGTVTVDRASGIFSVRPKRRRRSYDLPLDKVAEMVVQRIIKAEVFQKRVEKAARRKTRSGR